MLDWGALCWVIYSISLSAGFWVWADMAQSSSCAMENAVIPSEWHQAAGRGTVPVCSVTAEQLTWVFFSWGWWSSPCPIDWWAPLPPSSWRCPQLPRIIISLRAVAHLCCLISHCQARAMEYVGLPRWVITFSQSGALGFFMHSFTTTMHLSRTPKHSAGRDIFYVFGRMGRITLLSLLKGKAYEWKQWSMVSNYQLQLALLRAVSIQRPILANTGRARLREQHLFWLFNVQCEFFNISGRMSYVIRWWLSVRVCLFCFLVPSFLPTSLPRPLSLFLFTVPSGNHKFQLPEAGCLHATLCQRRSQLCDIHVDQAAVWGIPAWGLHHSGGHHWQEDVLHPARGGECPHQRQQGDQAGRWLLLWRCVFMGHPFTVRPTASVHMVPNSSHIHRWSSMWYWYLSHFFVHLLFISAVLQLFI